MQPKPFYKKVSTKDWWKTPVCFRCSQSCRCPAHSEFAFYLRVALLPCYSQCRANLAPVGSDQAARALSSSAFTRVLLGGRRTSFWFTFIFFNNVPGECELKNVCWDFALWCQLFAWGLTRSRVPGVGSRCTVALSGTQGYLPYIWSRAGKNARGKTGSVLPS